MAVSIRSISLADRNEKGAGQFRTNISFLLQKGGESTGVWYSSYWASFLSFRKERRKLSQRFEMLALTKDSAWFAPQFKAARKQQHPHREQNCAFVVVRGAQGRVVSRGWDMGGVPAEVAVVSK